MTSYCTQCKSVLRPYLGACVGWCPKCEDVCELTEEHRKLNERYKEREEEEHKKYLTVQTLHTEDKLANLERMVAELCASLSQVQIQQVPLRLRVTLRGERGRPQFFYLDPKEDFTQTVKRMNTALVTTDHQPRDKHNTPYTSLDDFRPDDLVYLCEEVPTHPECMVTSNLQLMLQCLIFWMKRNKFWELNWLNNKSSLFWRHTTAQ